MTRLQALPHKFRVCKSLIIASVVWIVILISFYYSLDPELVEDIEKTRVSLVNFKGQEKLIRAKADEDVIDWESIFNDATTMKASTRITPANKKLNEPFIFKTLLTPVPPEILKELALVNPGEMGRPVRLRNVSEGIQRRIEEVWKRHQFNEFLSDIISIRRSLPDPRETYCKQDGLYLEDLPSTSVIIIFHNEAWSTLLRSVHSVLDRSPEHLIEEIILVDDFSNMRKKFFSKFECQTIQGFHF